MLSHLKEALSLLGQARRLVRQAAREIEDAEREVKKPQGAPKGSRARLAIEFTPRDGVGEKLTVEFGRECKVILLYLELVRRLMEEMVERLEKGELEVEVVYVDQETREGAASTAE